MSPQIPHQHQLERNFRIAYLIGNFVKQSLTDDEEIELEQWMLEGEENVQLFEELTAEETVQEFLEWFDSRDTESRLSEVKQRLTFASPTKKRSWWPYWAAACAILVLSVLGYVAVEKEVSGHLFTEIPMTNDLQPGINSAVIRLGNGRLVDLTNTKDFVIDNKLRIKDHALYYDESASAIDQYEVSTPKKGFYQFRLPDGTKVWLNALSTITYPSAFKGDVRRVMVTGESFFEVAKDSAHPFVVTVNGLEVMALGTAFNINAYSDEPGVKATLREGVIKVTDGSREKLLVPGQQLTINKSGWQLQAQDVTAVAGWTRNEFKLKEASIQEIMRMAARWYGAKVVYEDQINDHFTATIDRNVPISHLLKLLEQTGEVNFRIQRDSIIVTK